MRLKEEVQTIAGKVTAERETQIVSPELERVDKLADTLGYKWNEEQNKYTKKRGRPRSV
jgi:hypothetical protein